MTPDELLKYQHPLTDTLNKIMSDARYVEGIKYGVPRKGHPEGSVGKHIADLLANLDKMWEGGWLSGDEFWKLTILIHVHDIMKYAAKPDSAINDPQSHASLAAKFLSEFSDDKDLINMVQAHDENLALWQRFKLKGSYPEERLKERVLDKIKDIELLLLFQIIDSSTPGKTDMKVMPRWFVDEVNKHNIYTPRVYSVLELFGL